MPKAQSPKLSEDAGFAGPTLFVGDILPTFAGPQKKNAACKAVHTLFICPHLADLTRRYLKRADDVECMISSQSSWALVQNGCNWQALRRCCHVWRAYPL